MATVSDSEIVDDFEYVSSTENDSDCNEDNLVKESDLNRISDVPSVKTSAELSMIREELKALRIENEELKKDRIEIKQALENVLQLQKTILMKTSNSPAQSETLCRIQGGLEALTNNTASLYESFANLRKDVSEIKTVMTNNSENNSYENPIELEINGEWKLVKSIDVDEFLDAQKDISPLEASRVRHSNVFFEIKKNQVKTCNWLKQCLNIETHYFSLPNKDGEVFSIENNKLVSVQKRQWPGEKDLEVFSIIERFVEDGKLRIIWERNGFFCERVYEKLDNWSSRTDPFNTFN